MTIQKLDGDKVAVSPEAMLDIVPPVVQAPTPVEELLPNTVDFNWSDVGIKPVLYTDVINDKQVCRDDLWLATTSELQALTNDAFMKSRVAAPIVATVQSEPSGYLIEYQDIEPGEGVTTIRYLSETADHPSAKPLYAAPSTAEQASDVRNAAYERSAKICDEWPSTRWCADIIRSMKSATPADKGNAPVEAKS